MSEVLLGVGGGIAAYKSCELLRRLQEKGYAVTVIPTPASLNFVGRATWEALSGKPVHTEVWEAVDQVNHVKLGDRAQYIIIAPATADLIARLAHGRADDLLTNSVLASNAKKLLVPAMHPKMWFNDMTQRNLSILKNSGFIIMPPSEGRLTGSDSGVGRLPEVPEIIEFFETQVLVNPDLVGRRILITTGGTREAIDEVRFIGNRSSGKQGILIAQIAKQRGADVTVIAANVDTTNLFGCQVISVENTLQLQDSLRQQFPKSDVLIMAAAVSDARPALTAGKIKKTELDSLKLLQNPDLLAEISKQKKDQIIVGFAAEESKNLLSEGHRKLKEKKLDLIYANDIRQGEIFGSDETSGYLIDSNGETVVKPTSKANLAKLLLDMVAKRLDSANV